MGTLRLLIIILILCLLPLQLMAKPRPGFHEGPYIRIIGGVVNTDFDNNARTGQKVGNDFEGSYGFQFGWHLWDSMAPELEMRYATKKIGNNREHVVFINLNAKYSFVTKALTKMTDLQILPFVFGGPSALLAAVPGDPAINNKVNGVYGGGIGVGAGIDFLVKKYVYLAIFGQGDFLHITSVYQTLGTTRVETLAGGWEPMFSIMAAAGVHF